MDFLVKLFFEPLNVVSDYYECCFHVNTISRDEFSITHR